MKTAIINTSDLSLTVRLHNASNWIQRLRKKLVFAYIDARFLLNCWRDGHSIRRTPAGYEIIVVRGKS